MYLIQKIGIDFVYTLLAIRSIYRSKSNFKFIFVLVELSFFFLFDFVLWNEKMLLKLFRLSLKYFRREKFIFFLHIVLLIISTLDKL